jgi:hypothetical protein
MRTAFEALGGWAARSAVPGGLPAALNEVTDDEGAHDPG